MLDITKHIVVELSGYRLAVMDVSQGDRMSRAVSCRLLDNGTPWLAPPATRVVVSYRLPDGTPGSYDTMPDGSAAWNILDNIVTVRLSDRLTVQSGTAELSIVLIGEGGQQLAVWPLRLNVVGDEKLTTPENLPALGEGYEGKLLFGGKGGIIEPLGVGEGLFLEDGELRSEGGGGNAAELIAQHNASAGAHPDIRREVATLAARLSALADSDDTTLDQLSEIVAYIKRNKTLIDAVTTSKVSVADIVNDLVTSATNKPLSAEQGRVLKNLYDQLETRIGDAVRELGSKVGADELAEAVETALTEAKESGAFDGEDGYTPVKGVDYFTPAEVQEIAGIAAGMVDVPSGGENWEFIGEFNVGTEDVTTWTITEDAAGNPIELSKMYIEYVIEPSASTTANTNLLFGNPAWGNMFAGNVAYLSLAAIATTQKTHFVGEGISMWLVRTGDRARVVAMRSAAQYNVTWSLGNSRDGINYHKNCIHGLGLQSANFGTGLIGAGSIIKMWGVRV